VQDHPPARTPRDFRLMAPWGSFSALLDRNISPTGQS
jgi:hypothetical protein